MDLGSLRVKFEFKTNIFHLINYLLNSVANSSNFSLVRLIRTNLMPCFASWGQHKKTKLHRQWSFLQTCLEYNKDISKNLLLLCILWNETDGKFKILTSYSFKRDLFSHFINPFTPTSDQDRISPYNITTISSRQVMKIEKNINPGIISGSNTKFSELTS